MGREQDISQRLHSIAADDTQWNDHPEARPGTANRRVNLSTQYAYTLPTGNLVAYLPGSSE